MLDVIIPQLLDTLEQLQPPVLVVQFILEISMVAVNINNYTQPDPPTIPSFSVSQTELLIWLFELN